MIFRTKHPIFIAITASTLLLVGIWYANTILKNNKYKNIYSLDQTARSIRNHNADTFEDYKTNKPTDLVPMLSFSEENTIIISDINFSKQIPLDPLKYLQENLVVQNASNTIRFDWITISTVQAGTIMLSDLTTNTIPLVLFKLTSASMQSHVEVFATFAHDNVIYYFPLYQNQDMASSSYDLNKFLENYKPDLHAMEFRKININTKLVDLFPPQEIIASNEHFVLIPFFPHTSCIEGGVDTFSYTKDAIGQCAQLLTANTPTSSWSIKKISFKYPYKIVSPKNANYNHIELIETGKEPTEAQKIECWFSCIDYSDYRFIEGPAGLFYSYKLEK